MIALLACWHFENGNQIYTETYRSNLKTSIFGGIVGNYSRFPKSKDYLNKYPCKHSSLNISQQLKPNL
jgi:hypothetical protein